MPSLSPTRANSNPHPPLCPLPQTRISPGPSGSQPALTAETARMTCLLELTHQLDRRGAPLPIIYADCKKEKHNQTCWCHRASLWTEIGPRISHYQYYLRCRVDLAQAKPMTSVTLHVVLEAARTLNELAVLPSLCQAGKNSKVSALIPL